MSITLKEFSGQLKKNLQSRLDEFNCDRDDLLKIADILQFVRDCLRELKEFISAYQFESIEEEINFFKEIKPGFLKEYFFFKKLFSVRLSDSFKELKTRQMCYSKALREMETFAHRNHELYLYKLSNSTHLDRNYFTRSEPQLLSFDQDERFTTGFDTKLAKILANEDLKKYIHEKLQRIQNTQHDGVQQLTWTGSKTALIELIYALHAAEVFNKGSADIKLLATTFSSSFGITLGNYYRVLQEIRIRKGSQTSFIDQMKKKLQERIDELDK